MSAVLAPAGVKPCGDAHPGEKSVYCERPEGHDGGHLSQTRDRYWPEPEPRTAPPCESAMTLKNGGELKCTLDDGHDDPHSAVAGRYRWLGTAQAAS